MCCRLISLALLSLAGALDNGFTRPPMGFNPWNCFGVGRTGHYKLNVSWAHGFNDSVIRSVADAFVASGLKDAGYEYVNLDCGWTTGFRDQKTGEQIVNTTRYPHGIKDLADYVHERGLKFGIYSSASTSQCCSKFYPGANDGSLDHEEQDAKMFAKWGVDFLKFDGCKQEQRSYPAMRDALNKTGRSIFISINGWNMSNPDPGSVANAWRTTGDDDVEFIPKLIDGLWGNEQYAGWQSAGSFNDPDMLEVGNYPMTTAESRAHFSLWCVVKAPLIIGTDVTNMTASTLMVLTNKEAIAVNQDSLGIQGRKLWNSSAVVPPTRTSGGSSNLGRPVFPVAQQSIWGGKLQGGAYAAVLFNAGTAASTITLTWDMLGIEGPSSSSSSSSSPSFFMVRDLWQHEDLGAHTEKFEAAVQPHDVVFVKLTPA